jgi:hypothetical protein
MLYVARTHLVIVLILVRVGEFSGHFGGYGYGFILIVIAVLLLMGRL